MSTTVEAPASTTRRTHSGGVLRRAKGFAALAVIALAGLGSVRLAGSRSDARLTLVLEVRDEESAAAQVFLEEKASLPGSVSPRVVLARTPLAFDPDRSLVTFPDGGGPWVVPRNAAVVLVSSERRIQPLKAPFPWQLLERLSALSRRGEPPQNLAAWFTAPPQARILEADLPEVYEFWRR